MRASPAPAPARDGPLQRGSGALSRPPQGGIAVAPSAETGICGGRPGRCSSKPHRRCTPRRRTSAACWPHTLHSHQRMLPLRRSTRQLRCRAQWQAGGADRGGCCAPRSRAWPRHAAGDHRPSPHSFAACCSLPASLLSPSPCSSTRPVSGSNVLQLGLGGSNPADEPSPPLHAAVWASVHEPPAVCPAPFWHALPHRCCAAAPAHLCPRSICCCWASLHCRALTAHTSGASGGLVHELVHECLPPDCCAAPCPAHRVRPLQAPGARVLQAGGKDRLRPQAQEPRADCKGGLPGLLPGLHSGF